MHCHSNKICYPRFRDTSSHMYPQWVTLYVLNSGLPINVFRYLIRKFSRVFNFANFANFQPFCKIYFNEKFLHVNYSFHVQECHGQQAAESTRDALQRDTFEADIALLTAASSSAYDGVTVLRISCLYATPKLHYVCGMCMVQTAKLQNYFNKNYHSRKFRPLKI